MNLTTSDLMRMLFYGTADDAKFAREALANDPTFSVDVANDLWKFRMMLHPEEQTLRSVS